MGRWKGVFSGLRRFVEGALLCQAVMRSGGLFFWVACFFSVFMAGGADVGVGWGGGRNEKGEKSLLILSGSFSGFGREGLFPDFFHSIHLL